jgi:uncharacterized SAM-binding protein YcdF (DUF218 family)
MFEKLIKWTKIFFLSVGVLSTFLIAGAFTRIPYDVQVWLGTNNSEYKFSPDYIIFLGGSGMPSGDNLVRLYYVAALAKKSPESKIIIAHPLDDAVINQMKSDLMIHGVDSIRILIEKEGTSTREQALKIKKHFNEIVNRRIVIITSPEYMCRSVSCFRKVGFLNVGGIAAFENAMFVNLKYSHHEVGGKAYLPDVSDNIALRYNFWNYLKLEITCIRELMAIAYYKLNGWM